MALECFVVPARRRSAEPVVDSGASKQEETMKIGAGALPGWYEMRDEHERVLIRVVFDTEQREIHVQSPEGGLGVVPQASNDLVVKYISHRTTAGMKHVIGAIEGWGGWTGLTPGEAVELQEILDELKRKVRAR